MRVKENAIDSILVSRARHFAFDFLEDSKALYYDSDGKLIHPGEFGVYREKLCTELLRNVVPTRLDFGTGFVVNSDGKVSHQCDIVIYDAKNTPLIENDEKQRFFPVESVVGIGEVKSTMKKTEFDAALQRLAQVKSMRDAIESSRKVIYKAHAEKKYPYNPELNPRDQIFTFLICDSVSFKCDQLVNEFSKIYGDVPPRLRHNMILSVKDASFMYFHPEQKISFPYPHFGNDVLKNYMVQPFKTNDDEACRAEYAHILHFLNYMYLGISNTTILYPELSHYIRPGLLRNSTVEL